MLHEDQEKCQKIREEKCIQVEEKESLLQLDQSSKSKEQSDTQVNEEIDDAEHSRISDMFKSNKSIACNIIILAAEIAIIIYSTHIRELCVVYFCRNLGVEVSEAMASFTILFDLFSLIIPFAFTQGYSFKASETYARKDFKYLGRLTNKTNFILLILSFVSISILFGGVLPIIGLFLKNERTVAQLRNMLIWHALGLPITYLQFVQFRYLCALEKAIVASVFVCISVVFEIGFAYLFIKVLGMVGFGVGISITFGFVLNYLMNLVYIRVKKPCEESLIGFTEGMFDNFWNYAIYTLILGGIVFTSYFSMTILPFYGLLLGDMPYTLTNIFTFVMNMFTNDPFPIAVNILINYLIAIKQYDKINRLIVIGLGLSAIVLVFYSCIIIFGFELIAKLFSDQDMIINSFSDNYRLWFLFCLIVIYYQSYIAEVLSAIGGENYSLTMNIIGRLFLGGSITLICIYFLKLGFLSILIGVLAGQLFTLSTNFGYYFYLQLNNKKVLMENLEEVEKFTSIDKITD